MDHFWTNVMTFFLLMSGCLLMFIVLLQRGRGGGLAGAFGGLGGASAFGTKAGDVFTKITIVLAVIWVILAGGTGFFMRMPSDQFGGGEQSAPKEPQIQSTNEEDEDADKLQQDKKESKPTDSDKETKQETEGKQDLAPGEQTGGTQDSEK